MPLSEDEQRILHQIEQQFYESDPAFAREVAKTTVYRHAGRNLKWAALGFFLGFVLLIASFTFNQILGFAGFLVMLGCAFVFERNLRKEGRSRLQDLRQSVGARNFGDVIGDTRRRLRDRFNRER